MTFQRVNTRSPPTPMRRYYLDLCILSLGRFHHNISQINWDSLIRHPINQAARDFWILADLDIEQ